MSTLIVKDISKELAEFERITGTIKELEEQCMPLKIEGLDDRDGYKAVHEARMNVKRLRVDVEKRRKELKADSLEIGRKIDAVAKTLTNLIEPIETHLLTQQKTVDEEKERLRKEQEEKERLEAEAKLQKRCDLLDETGEQYNLLFVSNMSDEGFAGYLEDMQQRGMERRERERIEQEERLKREAEEAERKRAEEQRLAAERAELERLRAEHEAREAEARKLREAEEKRQAEERAKIEEERRKVEAERREQERQAELERVKRETEERAKREERERIEREEKERLEREAEERRQAEEDARLKPDVEKLAAYIKKVDSIQLPHFVDATVEQSVTDCKQRFINDLNGVLGMFKPKTTRKRN